MTAVRSALTAGPRLAVQPALTERQNYAPAPPPVASTYLRPGGVFTYRRPDGTSTYLRP